MGKVVDLMELKEEKRLKENKEIMDNFIEQYLLSRLKNGPIITESDEVECKSRIENCIIQGKNNETIFAFKEDGSAIVNLDGYAIIPRDEYLRLKEYGEKEVDND